MTEPIFIDGQPYVTTRMAAEALTDAGVTAALIRRWACDQLLQPARDPDGQPIRVPGLNGRGRVTIYPWLDILRVERQTRRNRTGRPRNPR